jgi:hypothetical protein
LLTAATGFEPQFPAHPLNASAAFNSHLTICKSVELRSSLLVCLGCEALLHELKQVLAVPQLDGAAAITILKGVA